MVPYDYYVDFVDLTADEYEEYKILTHQAMKYIHSKDPKLKSIGDAIIIKRSKIIRDAKQKMDKFIDIMKRISDVKHLLVFCSEKQMPKLHEILDNSSEKLGYESPSYREITYNNQKNKKERIKILEILLMKIIN